jgi:hypothetical protein
MPRQLKSRSASPKAIATDEFEFAIKTKTGQVIETVREAFDYIEALPAKTQQRSEWQLAIRELHRAVTKDRKWLFFARMAINRAIHGERISTFEQTKAELWKEKRKAVRAKSGSMTKAKS